MHPWAGASSGEGLRPALSPHYRMRPLWGRALSSGQAPWRPLALDRQRQPRGFWRVTGGLSKDNRRLLGGNRRPLWCARASGLGRCPPGSSHSLEHCGRSRRCLEGPPCCLDTPPLPHRPASTDLICCNTRGFDAPLATSVPPKPPQCWALQAPGECGWG